MSLRDDVISLFMGPLYKRKAFQAKREADRRGLTLSDRQLEGHALAGGNPVAVVRAMARARDLGVDAPWDRACAMDLVGQNVEKAVEEALVEREVIFDRIQSDGGDLIIEGNCRDGSSIRVNCRLRLRNGFRITKLEGRTLEAIQESIALRAVLAIGQAESALALRTRPIQAELEWFVRERVNEVISVEIAFEDQQSK